MIWGVCFETWKYFMALSEQVGFEVETFFGSEIIKHFIKIPRLERIHTDWIIVLRKRNEQIFPFKVAVVVANYGLIPLTAPCKALCSSES